MNEYRRTIARFRVAHPREAHLLRLLGHSAGLTRAELSRHLALSKATVSAMVGDLLARGVLRESEPAGSGGAVGRPGTLVRLSGPDRTFAVLVWGRDELRVVLRDFAGTTLADRSVSLTWGLAPDDLVSATASALADTHRAAGSDPALTVGAVLALPAPFQQGVGIPPPGDPPMWAIARRFSTDPVPALADRLGVPVLAENDANLAALGEFVAGAGRGHESVAYVKLTATTIGMGLVLDGRIYRGASGFAGELAHIQVNPDGPLCHCGGRGCLHGLLGEALLDAVRPAYDRPIGFADVLDLAVAGEQGPMRILDDLGRTLGQALADFCTLLNPSAIIIDGGLGAAGPLVAAGVTDSINRRSAPHAARAVEILCGTLGRESEPQGALALLVHTARS
jgi:predicted NBD/HSP70 family sugar kinase